MTSQQSLDCLIRNLKDGSLSCQDIIKVMTIKAIEATEATNCVTEFLYDDAIKGSNFTIKEMSGNFFEKLDLKNIQISNLF